MRVRQAREEWRVLDKPLYHTGGVRTEVQAKNGMMNSSLRIAISGTGTADKPRGCNYGVIMDSSSMNGLNLDHAA